MVVSGLVLPQRRRPRAGSWQSSFVRLLDGGGFSPPDIPGLTAWFAADKITGVADGATLSTWPDSSGNGNALVQATGGDEPTYYKSTAGKTVNGLPAVWWEASTDYMATEAFASALSTGTVFVVGQISETVVFLMDGIGASNRWYIESGASDKVNLCQGGATIQTPALTFPTGIIQLTGLLAGDSTSAFRMNGSLQSTGNIGSNTLTGITLGAMHGGGSSNDAGTVCEVVLYDSVLSSTDYGQVESYLMSKWGIA